MFEMYYVSKVIIDMSSGVVSLLEQDTIENVSWPIKNKKKFFELFKRKNQISLSSFYATF